MLVETVTKFINQHGNDLIINVDGNFLRLTDCVVEAKYQLLSGKTVPMLVEESKTMFVDIESIKSLTVGP